MFHFKLPHKLGAPEAMRRVIAELQSRESSNPNIKSEGFSYDGLSQTFTLNMLAYGRPAKTVIVFSDSDVTVTVEDEAGWFLDRFVIEPKLEHKLAEILK